ncbi:CheR family methyltransferase [Solirubrobacter soli]|uniref:CheR family methyltransferase n=1 Tax=Solirubrobacter soli TaxID=363832 RepID=UPI000428E57B|nr:CheR family methyltransferase [Solirubrobacter soli]
MRSELEHVSGLPLGSFRSEHVAQQVQRAFRREQVASEECLARVLRRDHDARGRFRRSVAISHGAMFRDPEQFALVEEVLLPRLLAGGKRLSVWSAGCADGAELHTLALVLARMEVLGRTVLLGSDLLEENLALARTGEYPDEVRARLRWERRDLASDGPPPGSWRLILCRNVAIYLSPEARRRVYATLVSALGSRGILLLGRSERLIDPGALGLRPVGPHAYERIA